ncbi:potassium channel subfamily K member 6-like [Argiope bruennichi]|uniref:potassium channel subfamily K member 6-like n=1 Tax=Argiope bruennichi TaxID=94029 RepID=UPI002494FBED|nr:potassium channel subfamily K member 6-like [Argiope bruennichi]
MTFLAFLTRFFIGQKNFIMGHKKGISRFFATIMYLGYLALGAYIFYMIEAPNEAKERQKIQKVKSNMLEMYPNMPEGAIDHLYSQLSDAGVKGIVTQNDTAKWTFGNSFLFAMTLLTTIGYGHLSPATEIGKVVCMIYTAIGIPITLLILALHVDMLTSISNAYKANLFRRLGFQHPFFVRTLHFFSVMVFIVVGTFFLPAWVFYSLEAGWSYLDAIYFCFISLTTVGLGDFVPGLAVQHPHVELYRFLATLYLIMGVTVVMFMMGLATDYYQNCNKGYHVIPVKIIPEKAPILPKDPPAYGDPPPPSYGAIIIPETIDETRLLLS